VVNVAVKNLHILEMQPNGDLLQHTLRRLRYGLITYIFGLIREENTRNCGSMSMVADLGWSSREIRALTTFSALPMLDL
jgi:hypothetical protein